MDNDKNIENNIQSKTEERQAMTPVPDFVMKVFANNAINVLDEGNKPTIEAFGSTAENGPESANYTDDAQAIVDAPAWENGGFWDATITVAGLSAPPGSDFNAFGNATSKAIINNTNRSLQTYNPNRVYYTNDSCTLDGGQIFISLVDNNINNEPLSNIDTFWQKGLADVGNIDNLITANTSNLTNALNSVVESSGVKVQINSSGLINPQEENSFSVNFDNISNPNTITVGAIDKLAFIKSPGTSTLDSDVISIPEQTFLIIPENLPTPPNPDCTILYYLCYNANGEFVATETLLNSSTDLCSVAVFAVTWDSNVPFLADLSNPVSILPSLASVAWDNKGILNRNQNINIFPNASLSFSLNQSLVSCEGINFVTSALPNTISELILNPQNPVTFNYVDPSLLNSTNIYPSTTTVDPSQYWDGTDLVSVPAGNATIQRLFRIIDGNSASGIMIQYGEQTYPDLATALNSIDTTSFTTLFKPEFVFPLGELVVLQNATNLTDVAQAIWRKTGSNASTGGSVIPNHNNLNGLEGGTPASNYYGHVPSIVNQSGKFLTNNGSDLMWNNALPNTIDEQYPRFLRVKSSGDGYEVSPKIGVVITDLAALNPVLASGITYSFNNGTVQNAIPDGGNDTYNLLIMCNGHFQTGIDNVSYIAVSTTRDGIMYFGNKPQGRPEIVWNRISSGGNSEVQIATTSDYLVTTTADSGNTIALSDFAMVKNGRIAAMKGRVNTVRSAGAANTIRLAIINPTFQPSSMIYGTFGMIPAPAVGTNNMGNSVFSMDFNYSINIGAFYGTTLWAVPSGGGANLYFNASWITN